MNLPPTPPHFPLLPQATDVISLPNQLFLIFSAYKEEPTMREIMGREGSERISGLCSFHLGPQIFKLPPWPENRLWGS